MTTKIDPSSQNKGWLYHNWLIAIGCFVLIVTLGMTLHQQYCASNDGIAHELIENYIAMDSTLVELSDAKSKSTLITTLDSIAYQYKTSSQDSLVNQLNSYSLSTLIEVLKSKNETVYKYHRLDRESELTNSPKLNIWLLTFIVILSGFIGGLARGNYKYLEDLVNKVRVLESSAEEILNIEGAAFIGKSDLQLSRYKSARQEVNDLLENITPEGTGISESNSQRANLIFGLVASSLSFIVLKFADSKVLEFGSEIDYFIFFGWCLIGAIFAKNWIKSIYDRISSNIST